MYKKADNLDDILQASAGRKILLFKHSSSCGISSGAKREMDSFLEANPDAEVYLLIVQEQRSLSGAIAEKLGVVHESPQLILVENGKALESWSHWKIKKSKVEAAIA